MDWAERVLIVLGVLGMFGFVASHVGVMLGLLDAKHYVLCSLGSLLDYGAALLIVRRAYRTSPWESRIVPAQRWVEQS